MSYDFDTPINREGTSCIKWDRRKGKFQEPDILPLWIADTDFASPEAVSEAIVNRTKHPVYGYSYASESFYTGIINWFKERHHVTFEKSWIKAGVGVVTAISYGVQALTREGDRVLILTPVYDPFGSVVKGTGRELIECPLTYAEHTYTINYDEVEKNFKAGVKAIILCNPHNPVGRVWTQQELKKLVDLCIKYQVYIISDEIHCDFDLFGHSYTSLIAFPEAYDLLVVCIAPGKSFNVSGLAISATVVPNPDINTALTKRLRSAWLINPSVIGLEAAAAAYNYGAEWMDEQKKYIEGNSTYVQNRLALECPHIIPSVHEGTFLMWLDFSAFNMDNAALEQEIIHTYHLGLNSGWHYGEGTGGDGFMRLNIGCSRELLKIACDRFAEMEKAHFSK